MGGEREGEGWGDEREREEVGAGKADFRKTSVGDWRGSVDGKVHVGEESGEGTEGTVSKCWGAV